MRNEFDRRDQFNLGRDPDTAGQYPDLAPRRRRQDRPLLLDVRPEFFSMKITQEVRDFAAKQNTDSFLAATNSSPSPLGEGDHAKHGGGAASAEAEAARGMAAMSEKFREKGGEIYLRDERPMAANKPS